MLGDAGADDDVFDRAGVDRAGALVVTTEDPHRKIAITLQAHARNPALRIAATGANRERGALLQHAGASEVVVADDLIAGALIGDLGRRAAPERIRRGARWAVPSQRNGDIGRQQQVPQP